MGRRVDLTGQRFGHLTVIECAGSKNGRTFWYCKCDCGRGKTIATRYLREGKTTSCGCTYHDHGGSKTRLYCIWRGMKRRCNNPNSKDYPGYGAKGITVCAEWNESFPAFRDWAMANGYKEELTIDRIDSTGNYEPSNCRWADIVTQSNNRCTNVFVEIEGEVHTLADWARKTGLNSYVVRDRYRSGKRGYELIKQG